MSGKLLVGASAPDFTMTRDGGGEVRLSDLKGKTVVLYFYPKDDTPGCTKEAVGFTELAADFKKAGAVVVGVSKDSIDKHDKFKAKHGLDVILGSDPDGKVIRSYGSWVEKSMYGKTFMGIDRSTFVIDPQGVLRHVWRKVKVAGHAEEVLAAVRELKT